MRITNKINNLNDLMNYIASSTDFSTQMINNIYCDILDGFGDNYIDDIKETRNNELIRIYTNFINSMEEEEYTDEDYHDEIYMIESEDGRVFYDYDDVEIVNSLINQGLDCTVYKASLEGWEDFSLNNSSDIAQLDNLDWERVCIYKA